MVNISGWNNTPIVPLSSKSRRLNGLVSTSLKPWICLWLFRRKPQIQGLLRDSLKIAVLLTEPKNGHISSWQTYYLWLFNLRSGHLGEIPLLKIQGAGLLRSLPATFQQNILEATRDMSLAKVRIAKSCWISMDSHHLIRINSHCQTIPLLWLLVFTCDTARNLRWNQLSRSSVG